MLMMLLGPRLMMSSIGQACLSAEQARPWPEPAAAQRGSSNGGRGRGRGALQRQRTSPLPRAPSLAPLLPPSFVPTLPFPTSHPFLSPPHPSLTHYSSSLPFPYSSLLIPYHFKKQPPHPSNPSLPSSSPLMFHILLLQACILVLHPTLTTTFNLCPLMFHTFSAPRMHSFFIQLLPHAISCSNASFVCHLFHAHHWNIYVALCRSTH